MATLERAIEIAMLAHKGASDKAGAPSILHPLRLMFAVENPEAKIVAVLHDVVEDSKPPHRWGFEELKAEGLHRSHSAKPISTESEDCRCFGQHEYIQTWCRNYGTRCGSTAKVSKRAGAID